MRLMLQGKSHCGEQAMRSLGQDRIKSAAGVALLHALLGYAFVAGLGISIPAKVERSLKMFEVLPDPVPPPLPPAIRPTRERTPEREGAASPPNLRAQASPVVAPVPEVRLEIPPPVIAAPVPRQGLDTSAGAAPIPGPGSGSGGLGDGTGSGDSGTGAGGGGGGSPLRWLNGAIHDSDYPMSALEKGIGGTVYLRFVVGVKGRVTSCTVTRSSGNAALDETTCRLIQRRFRYRPERDARGRPVPIVVNGEHEWTAERRPDVRIDPVPEPQTR